MQETEIIEIDLGEVVGEVNPESVIEFETPEEYTVPNSGDSIKKLLGKITKGLNKIFEEKFDKSQIVDNLNTTEDGFALSGKMGKKLGDDVSEIKETLTDKVIQYTSPNANILHPLNDGNIISYMKTGNVKRIKIQGNIKTQIVAGIDAPFVKIPEGFLPVQSEHVSWVISGNNNGTPMAALIIIRRDGTVYLNSAVLIPVGKWLAIDVTYV